MNKIDIILIFHIVRKGFLIPALGYLSREKLSLPCSFVFLVAVFWFMFNLLSLGFFIFKMDNNIIIIYFTKLFRISNKQTKTCGQNLAPATDFLSKVL